MDRDSIIADRASRDKWKRKYAKFDENRAKYDGWLDDFDREIEHCKTAIIDLGCGNGNNARYLSSKGKEVIACDYTQEALDLIREHIPEIQNTICFDMRDGLPFEDNFTSIVIADLSLHYFTEEDTLKILDEIKRVLRPDGLLFFRVNSINDIMHGAEEGIEIAKHYRRTEKDGDKRFFDAEDIEYFFREFEISYQKEEGMNRYEKDKKSWKCVAKVIK